jgi:phosphoribosyl-ATP pyrophosphohydrolase
MAVRAQQELDEYLNALDDYDGHAQDNPIMRVRLSEELIDCVFFVMVALHELGLDGEDVFRHFNDKHTVNGHRRDTGFKPHVYALREGA